MKKATLTKIKTLIISPLMRVQFQKPLRMLQLLALRGMNYGGGVDPTCSQEMVALKHALGKIGKDTAPVVFDVGANDGGYANAVLKFMGDKPLVMHSFEPSKKTFELLKQNVDDPRVSLRNIGLGDKNGTVALYSDAVGSGFASVYKRRLDHFGIKMTLSEDVELKTLDSYCRELSIGRINYLKMDVEGNELKALEGAKEMLSRGAIDFIQFEFGGCNIDSRTFFQDFYYLLNPKYRLYRMLNNGLYPIDRYDELLEVFITSNFLAEKRLTQ